MAKKTSKSVEQTAEVVAPPQEVTPAPEAPVEDAPVSVEGSVVEKFEQLALQVAQAATTLRDLQTSLKGLQKDVVKALKTSSKKSKTRSVGTKKTPSGFAKPTKLSDALCDFLGVEHGTEMARTDVTRSINAYIKEKGLQDKEDKRKIHPDAKLLTVLTVKPTDTLTFFNLQTHLKGAFLKV